MEKEAMKFSFQEVPTFFGAREIGKNLVQKSGAHIKKLFGLTFISPKRFRSLHSGKLQIPFLNHLNLKLTNVII